MKHTIWTGALITTFVAGTLVAGDLPRAYFGTTEPGQWARYETSVSGGGKNAATYTRLADDDGAFVVEIASEFLEGPGAGGISTSVFTLASDFDWRRRFLSFGKALTSATFVMEGRPPMPQPERMVTAMRESMADFTGGYEAAGTATYSGTSCDVYTFRGALGGPNPGTMTGKVCLSDTVPFGVVHQTATTSNEKSGESSFETVLVDSGAGAARSGPPRPSTGTATPAPAVTAKRTNIALAYQRGTIAIDFRVRANTGGRVFAVALTNLGSESLVVGVGTSTYAFEVGPPIGTLFFQPVDQQDIALAPAETSGEFHAAQTESRGVVEGTFRLVMVKGVPTLTGDMKVGKIK